MFGQRPEEINIEPMAAMPKPKRPVKVVEPKPDVIVVNRGGDKNRKVPIVFLKRTAEFRPGQTGTFPMWEAKRIIDAGRARWAPNIVWQK